MNRQIHTEPRRDPHFLDMYRAESARMRCPPPKPPKLQPASPTGDAAVILPLVLLLLTEGADRLLVMALLYILL